MALNQQDIAKIANLARLELTPERADKMQAQINEFFNIVEKMQTVDTQGVEPLAHPTHAMPKSVLRHIDLRHGQRVP